MKKKLDILHLEDLAADAGLVHRHLSKAGMDCEIKVVDNEKDYVHALKENNPDLILSDHSLPQFDSTKALELFRREKMNIPFILVTGAVSEEFAVQSLKKGADDYVLKSNLSRLPNAIRRALVEKKTKKERDELVGKLESSLQEKEVLLKEVHHRVKNNLAIITSLLNIQADTIKNKKVKSLLMESESRVRSMGMIHEMLYQQDNFSNIGFETYILKLLQFISSNYIRPGLSVKYHVSARDICLNINMAIPCALIMNELITNAYKHAFNGRQTGEIRISLSRENNKYTLSVKDNGVGMPEIKDKSTLGMTLVYGLARQMEGAVTINNSGGTTFNITFEGKPEH